MSTLSPLQLLPQHVVRLVVNHIVGSSRVLSDGVVVNSLNYKILLKPLLWVCSNFRAVAYSHYCHIFVLNLSSISLGDIDKPHLPVPCTDVGHDRLYKLGYSTHHSARDITLFLSDQSVYSGEALEKLSRAPYDGCAFPLARKIAFVLAMNAYDYVARDIGIDPLTAKANVCAFVERIKQMIPLVDEIRVQPVNCDDMPSMPDQQFGDLACRLYQLGHRIKYSCLSYDADPIWLQQDVVCNLSHISYLSASDVDSVNQFIQLARKNALTLQSLNIECEHNLGVLGIVQDDDGKHVVYPRLLTLKLRLWSKSDEWRRPEFYGAAPFPILRRLHLNLNSAFDDDTLFRGNAATLEWLELQLDRLGASMLRKYKVFVPGSHPRLRRLKIGFTADFGSVFTSPTEIQQFVCSIGSGAAMREYGRTPYLANPATTFSLLGKYECIQVLSLPNLYLELWHAISLIQSLPLLSDLQTSLPSLGTMRNGVDLDNLPEHIVSNYAPMGRQFRCWHLDRGHFNNYSGTTTCVLLLALACPNFDFATPPSSQRELFMEMMEKDISSDLFKPYAPRLRRLLFNGWNGKQN